MNTAICAQGFGLGEALEAHVRARLEPGLGRFDTHILAVDVFLKDVNGSKGGRDKLARIRVRLRSRRIIAVESTRSDVYASAAVAARRAKRAVKRSLKKQQRVDKRRLAAVVRDPDVARAGAG